MEGGQEGDPETSPYQEPDSAGPQSGQGADGSPPRPIEMRYVLVASDFEETAQQYADYAGFGQALLEYFARCKEEGFILSWICFRTAALAIGKLYPEEQIAPNDQASLELSIQKLYDIRF